MCIQFLTDKCVYYIIGRLFQIIMPEGEVLSLVLVVMYICTYMCMYYYDLHILVSIVICVLVCP